MKEQKMTSKLRQKFTGLDGAKAYKLTRAEALQFIKEHFIDPCTSVEQLDSLKLLPSFPLFKAPECTLNNWQYKHEIFKDSLFGHYYMTFYNEKDVYTCGLFWLTGGSFNRKVKKLVQQKKSELEKV